MPRSAAPAVVDVFVGDAWVATELVAPAAAAPAVRIVRRCKACGRFLTNKKNRDRAWECPSNHCALTGIAIPAERAECPDCGPGHQCPNHGDRDLALVGL